jgi:hypothetical protein
MEVLDDGSKEYFAKMRAERAGKQSIEELALHGEERKRKWELLKEYTGKVAEKAEKPNGKDADGEERLFAGGKEPIFEDMVLLGWLIYFKKLLPTNEWEMIEGWHGGRWKRMLNITTNATGTATVATTGAGIMSAVKSMTGNAIRPAQLKSAKSTSRSEVVTMNATADTTGMIITDLAALIARMVGSGTSITANATGIAITATSGTGNTTAARATITSVM